MFRLFLNPQAVGMAVAQNVTNVKFKSQALFFNSKFDHKLFSSLKLRNRKTVLENFQKFIYQERHIRILI